jgi:hypothetical protein
MKRVRTLLLRAAIASLLLSAFGANVASANPGTFHWLPSSGEVPVAPDVLLPEDPGLTRLPEDPGLTVLPEDPGLTRLSEGAGLTCLPEDPGLE